jgi:hypothetical protein
MSLVLPALRLGRVQRKLEYAGLDFEQRQAVMQIIEDEIETDARRIGVVCPTDGCNRILDCRDQRVRVCSEHGSIPDDLYLPLAIAFDPVP